MSTKIFLQMKTNTSNLSHKKKFQSKNSSDMNFVVRKNFQKYITDQEYFCSADDFFFNVGLARKPKYFIYFYISTHLSCCILY